MTGDEYNAWLRDGGRRTLVMGVLNVTPDSFSDGGAFLDPAAALAHARRMIADGADLIDVGAESTRPGAARVGAAEQLRRLQPVLGLLAPLQTTISIDTTSSQVARAALKAGVAVINDISAGRDDPEMLALAARHGASIILMHAQGPPATMQDDPRYDDVVAEVARFLAERRDAALAAGVETAGILLDPGLGFGKTDAHNLQLLHGLGALAALGRPLVVGPSRKRFITAVTGEGQPRLAGTAAAVAWCAAHDVGVIRVHDVAVMARVARMIRAIRHGWSI